MSLLNPTLTEETIDELEGASLIEALELAIKALEKEAEIYIVAAKMVASRGEDAVPEAKKDANRRTRLLAAAATLQLHKASLIPF